MPSKLRATSYSRQGASTKPPSSTKRCGDIPTTFEYPSFSLCWVRVTEKSGMVSPLSSNRANSLPVTLFVPDVRAPCVVVQALRYLEAFPGVEGEGASASKISCSLNSAMCHLKSERFPQCIKACERALELDPKNVKGHFRKVVARP